MPRARRPLAELEGRDAFVPRHIGPTDEDIAQMLQELELVSLDELVARAVPSAIRSRQDLQLPAARNEPEVLAALRSMADANEVLVSMIGMGYYATHLPSVILRNLLENPGWYTAYTPYQAEISQGRLEALLNFQQMVMDLTAMDLATASLLDEATAAAEAMAMSRRLAKSKSMTFFVDRDCHPQSIAIIRTRARPLDIDVLVGDPSTELEGRDVFGALVQYPGTSGAVRDFSPVVQQVHAVGGLVTVAADLLGLCLLTPPGELGADVVVGSAQRFGVPMGYGGPHAAFFATRDAFKRSTPGRIIGVSIDARGQPALRMALQTREQHIRREKATSNICTAQVLLANIAGFFAAYHGPEGLRTIATRVHRMTTILAAGLEQIGHTIDTESFFDTITVRVPERAHAIVERARELGINLRRVDAHRVGIACDETTTREHLRTLWRAFATDEAAVPDVDRIDASVQDAFPDKLRRTSPYLGHPVFHRYHSETEMMRYLRRLQSKDVALDRSMIPLGSCTMKLNAATEMLPVTWAGFGALHPFAPSEQAQGYRRLFGELEQWLCEVTGFDAVSLQPNAGSQGEYAGLLCIRKYHESRGEGARNVCLIPASAHGTNPASAMMAGMRVVVVACDDHGNVDVEDLRAKAKAHGPQLGALMITYPSTHGVFEEAVAEVCEIVHAQGGQVYLDGANLNAMLGVSKPAHFGADVSHMNLHKTFCIPHGGGGPGVGPIGVRSHLAAFLPDHPVVDGVNPAGPDRSIGPVSAAPWGSASILPISWAYIALMGGPGLRLATEVAILNANYVARRLQPHYPVLYSGVHGLVAHECIIDLRPIKASCGVTVDDIAKRLVDYGFHAPTMSFPVADTLMIEPTESESKRELDRFCDAMIAIRGEIASVESGQIGVEESVLRHAPHTADLLVGEWTRPYSREQAFFPQASLREDKYWPPVARVDNVYGDRHLSCACPPIEAYSEAAD